MHTGQVPGALAPGGRGRVLTHRLLRLCLGGLGVSGCIGEPARPIRQSAEALIPGALRADEPPVLLEDTPPFVYPRSAWAQRIQGNVLLRLYVDAGGRAVPESASVARTSGVPALDSAALAAVPSLRFQPARRGGRAVGSSVRFPVLYRHPDGPPMPLDTLR
jgi:protein TonB